MSRGLPWIVAGTVFLTADAWACSCGYVSLEQRYEAAENVFTAVVTGGSYDPSLERESVRSTFEVRTVFKGSLPFSTLSSHPEDGTCGFALEVGVEYLFFLRDSGEVGLCPSPVAAPDAQRELAALSAHAAGRPDALAPIWHFGTTPEGCYATVLLEAADTRNRLLDQAALSIRYTRPPDPDARDSGDGLVLTATSYGLESQRKRLGSRLRITVGDDTFAAALRRARNRIPGAYYELRGKDVLRLLDALPNSAAIDLFAELRHGASFDYRVRTANLGDTVEQFHACMQ